MSYYYRSRNSDGDDGSSTRSFIGGLLIGVVATIITTVLAIVLGLVAGYFRGLADGIIRNILDVLWAYPAVLLGITLGTVLVAEGLLNYLGPHGWFNRTLVSLGLIDRPIRLVQNYWGVFLSLIVTGFPFTFLLTLSMISGIDPALEQAAATLGARAHQRFRQIVLPLIIPGLAVIFCLAFVDAFSVFPTAVMIGAPAGETRVISLAASQAAFEQYDYSYASAIAMIMAAVQFGFVAAVLGLRGLFYRGPADGGKG